MSTQPVHLIKLCVGIDAVEDLARWQAHRARESGGVAAAYRPRHITRMWPKRAAEVLAGGSLYWVIKGFVQARQQILSLDEVMGEDGIRRCAIVMAPELIRTTATPRRPFQGWRYLAASDAPIDLPQKRTSEEPLPEAMANALAEIGLR